MGKLSQDVPQELKQWVKLFEVVTYRHDYSSFFSDWLTTVICALARETMESEYLQVMKRYNSEEHALMGQLFGEYLKVMQVMTAMETPRDDGSVIWYDALGQIYEAISQGGKRSGLGQFFTPPHIVDLMVKLTNYQDGQTFMEPCSGSGRMVIAAHCHSPGPTPKIAIDLDPICVKMTAVNMCMHGVRGEAICADSIRLDSYRFGYLINPRFFHAGIFSLKRENSIFWQTIEREEPKQQIIEPMPQVEANTFDFTRAHDF